MPKNHQSAVIVQGFYTPFIKSGQDFKDMPEEELGAWTLRELLERTQIAPKEIEELILGNTSTTKANIAHTVASRAGLSVASSTLQKRDTSTLEALFYSATKVQANLVDTTMVGGVENMSQMPLSLSPQLTNIINKIIRPNSSWKEKIKTALSLRLADLKLQFTNKELFMDPISGKKLRQKAEQLSKDFYISRKEQDEFVIRSFEKASEAHKNKKWQEEMLPVFPPFDFELVETDTKLHNIPSLDDLSKMSSSFIQDCGTVTPGNSSFDADGAALLLIMNKDKAVSLGYKPIVSIHTFASTGGGYLTHKSLMASPLLATKKVLEQAQLQIKDISLFEIDESFAVQALACLRAFESRSFAEKYLGQSSALGEVPLEKCNVNGGALSWGDPLAATSARMILNLAKEMKRQQLEWGLVTAGLYEDQASALILKLEK